MQIMLTWTLCNCCQFFAHEHQIWHQWMAPMCNSIACLPIQNHLKDQLHLVKRLHCQFAPLLYHHDNGQPSIHTGIFAVKTVARTEIWKIKKNMISCEFNRAALFIEPSLSSHEFRDKLIRLPDPAFGPWTNLKPRTQINN